MESPGKACVGCTKTWWQVAIGRNRGRRLPVRKWPVVVAESIVRDCLRWLDCRPAEGTLPQRSFGRRRGGSKTGPTVACCEIGCWPPLRARCKAEETAACRLASGRARRHPLSAWLMVARREHGPRVQRAPISATPCVRRSRVPANCGRRCGSEAGSDPAPPKHTKNSRMLRSPSRDGQGADAGCRHGRSMHQGPDGLSVPQCRPPTWDGWG